MDTITELTEILEEFGLPYYRQGSAPEQLPGTFITIWQIDGDAVRDYDNSPNGLSDLYSIVLYTTNANELTKLMDLAKILIAKGWGMAQMPADYPAYNEHYCRAMKARRTINL